MNFVKLYIGDYQRDTGHLSIAEHGAYLLMLQHYYATEKPLPIGKALHRLLRAESKADRDAVDSVAAQFWKSQDGGLINERAVEEIQKAEHQRTVNREIGKRGGRPKRTETQTESVIESVSEQEPNRNPNQTPDTRQKEKDSPASPGAELWYHAIAMLRDQGASQTAARSFIGLQCRDYDEETVAEAFSAAAGAASVKAYVAKYLKGKPRKGERPVGVEFKNGQATIGGFVA